MFFQIKLHKTSAGNLSRSVDGTKLQTHSDTCCECPTDCTGFTVPTNADCSLFGASCGPCEDAAIALTRVLPSDCQWNGWKSNAAGSRVIVEVKCIGVGAYPHDWQLWVHCVTPPAYSNVDTYFRAVPTPLTLGPKCPPIGTFVLGRGAGSVCGNDTMTLVLS